MADRPAGCCDERSRSPSRELTALEQAIAALEGQRQILGDQVVETALAPLVDKRDRLLAASVGNSASWSPSSSPTSSTPPRWPSGWTPRTCSR
jgi:hypothetical protein